MRRRCPANILHYRFSPIVRGKYSTGAVYFTVCNNPRDIRFLRGETILAYVLPGPHEPTGDQLNNVLELVVTNVQKLNNGACIGSLARFHIDWVTGVYFRVYGHSEPELTHSMILNNVSDLLATRLVEGLPSHNSTLFMCHLCTTPFYRLVDPDCFDPRSEYTNPVASLALTRYHSI